MTDSIRDRVFISYASEDLPTVLKIAEGLKSRKVEIWLDKYDLKPGKWKPQIKKAIAQSRYFIICISTAALNKTGPDIDEVGFQDEELDYAYDIAQSQSEREFTIIPVRLENCSRGDFRISSFQQYDLFENFETSLDNLSVDLGGIALGSDVSKVEKTEKEKAIDHIIGKALSAYYANDFGKSNTLIDCVLDIQPDHYNSWSQKGASLANLGKYDKAILAYQKSIELNPDEAGNWYSIGLILIKQNKKNEAIDAFQKSLKVNPNYIEAIVDMGLLYLQMENIDNALLFCERALKIDPEFSRAWSCKGLIYDSQGNHSKSIEFTNKAIQLSAPFYNPIDFFNKGQTHFKLGELEQAYNDFDIASKINPTFAESLFMMGGVLAKTNRIQEAYDTYNRIVVFNPDFPDLWDNIGMCCLILKKFPEAIQAYEKVTTTNPDDKQAWQNKAMAHYELRQFDAASFCCSKALQIDPLLKEALWLKNKLK